MPGAPGSCAHCPLVLQNLHVAWEGLLCEAGLSRDVALGVMLSCAGRMVCHNTGRRMSWNHPGKSPNPAHKSTGDDPGNNMAEFPAPSPPLVSWSPASPAGHAWLCQPGSSCDTSSVQVVTDISGKVWGFVQKTWAHSSASHPFPIAGPPRVSHGPTSALWEGRPESAGLVEEECAVSSRSALLPGPQPQAWIRSAQFGGRSDVWGLLDSADLLSRFILDFSMFLWKMLLFG